MRCYFSHPGHHVRKHLLCEVLCNQFVKVVPGVVESQSFASDKASEFESKITIGLKIIRDGVQRFIVGDNHPSNHKQNQFKQLSFRLDYQESKHIS